MAEIRLFLGRFYGKPFWKNNVVKKTLTSPGVESGISLTWKLFAEEHQKHLQYKHCKHLLSSRGFFCSAL